MRRTHLELFLDPLVLLGFGDASLLAAQIQLADALVGQLGAGLGVVLILLVVLALCVAAQGRWHRGYGRLQFLFGLLEVLLGRQCLWKEKRRELRAQSEQSTSTFVRTKVR